MHRSPPRHHQPVFAATLAACALAAPVSAQAFAVNTTDAPTDTTLVSNVDFGDVDGDGDWDAVFGASEYEEEQNRIWINQGGLQAGDVGSFLDETATRLPAVVEVTMDVELGDIDGDGDPDLFVANLSKYFDQPCRFWVNAAAGSGAFVDETASRWVGLGGAGSSVDPAIVLPGGGFVSWSSDGELADLDQDGDMDLVLSAGNWAISSALRPTRVFLNDGGGFFSELNPAGVQLVGEEIPDGVPALWAEGVQDNGTTASDGSEADVAIRASDVEVSDFDGDYDLDILVTDVNVRARLFLNRIAESGSLVFRDVTGNAIPTMTGLKSDAAVGDLDGDDDVDILGPSWSESGFTIKTAVFSNDGAGAFTQQPDLPNSSADFESADALDYDNDGDLDVLLAGFSGSSRLYRNDGGLDLQYVVPASSGIVTPYLGKDAEVADVDADGDYDLFVPVNEAFDRYFENVTQVPDTTAPRLPSIERLQDAAAAAGARPIRVHVLDNAPWHVTAGAAVELEASVDGVLLPKTKARWAGGQVFRAEIPANLVGDVAYRMAGTDALGNEGLSAFQSFTATGDVGSSFGTGSPGSLGEPTLRSLTAPVGGNPLHLAAGNTPPGTVGLFGVSLGTSPSLDLGDGFVFNLGLLEVFEIRTADASGDALLSFPILPMASGLEFHSQYWALDGAGGNTFASSPGLSLTIQ